ncbi:hypothetical protein D3C86_973630 [compost metagenome]
MRNQDQGTFILLQGFDQQFYRLHIQVVRRLIEQQEVGIAGDYLSQCYPRLFSSRQYFDLFKYIIAGKEEAAQELSQLYFCLITATGFQFLQNCMFNIQAFQLVLCIEAGNYIMPSGTGTFKRFITGNDAH